MVQPVFTCSKLTIEILEQGVKYVYNKDYNKFTISKISIFKISKFTTKTPEWLH